MNNIELIAKYEGQIRDCAPYGPEAERLPLGVPVSELRVLLLLARWAVEHNPYTGVSFVLMPAMSIEPDDSGDAAVDATSAEQDGNRD